MTPSETSHFRTVVVPSVAKIPSMEKCLEHLGKVVDELGKEVLRLRAQMSAPVSKRSKQEGKED